MTEYSDQYIMDNAKIIYPGFDNYFMIRDEHGNRLSVGLVRGSEILMTVDCHDIYLQSIGQRKNQKTEPEDSSITLDQAIDLLTQGDEVHTFRQGGVAILGVDIDRKRLLTIMKQYQSTLALSGKNAHKMKHGIVLCDDLGYLFIATDMEKLRMFEAVRKA